MSETSFVITPDGAIVKRTITDQPIQLLPKLAEVFQSTAVFRLSNLLDVADKFYGRCGATCSAAQPGTIHWSVRVKTLNLNAPFTMSDGVLVPDFAAGAEVRPMEIAWQPPDSMALVLGVTVRQNSSGYVSGEHYLIAYEGPVVWRLPLANLYDHGELCHGQESKAYPTAVDALLGGLKQFSASRWNSDLYHSFQQANAPLMFRFQPENDGFKQLPPAGDWTKLCQKIANEFIATNLMPV